MLDDVVVDTNVFAHCDNPIEIRARHAIEFVARLARGSTKLCVDEGFSLDRSNNRSKLGHEYLKYIHAGSPAMAVIAELAASERLKPLATKVRTEVNRQIKQFVYDPTDKIFIKLAVNSAEHVFTTHDVTHFPDDRCRDIQKHLNVNVVSAEDACPLIWDD